MEWLTEYSIEPFEQAEDSRAAMVAMMLANVNLRSGATPFTIDNFIAELRQFRQKQHEEPKEKPEITMDVFTAMLAGSGAAVVHGVRPTE